MLHRRAKAKKLPKTALKEPEQEWRLPPIFSSTSLTLCKRQGQREQGREHASVSRKICMPGIVRACCFSDLLERRSEIHQHEARILCLRAFVTFSVRVFGPGSQGQSHCVKEGSNDPPKLLRN
eukprot:3843602-Pleurochrysis_carterae.AAC.1